MNVIVLLADGVRSDTFAAAVASGAFPALARLRSDGGQFEITSAFPSVTGPAYAPFLLGRFPGGVGLPGLRWFDRSRSTCRFPDYSRSYAGYQLALLDSDLDAGAPTIFELVRGSVGALSVITRGLSRQGRVMALTPRTALRAALTHYLGDPRAMLDVDRKIGREVVARAGQTPFLFAAFGGVDKLSHAEGHDGPGVFDALRIVDDTVGALRHDLERRGVWQNARLWISSDHGHSRVTQHEDLAGLISERGHRVMAHPWVYRLRPEVAVMVSGNAMAHVYVDVTQRERPFLGRLTARWQALVDDLLARPSVDLLLAPIDASRCAVMSRMRGTAIVTRANGCYWYLMQTGDPLGLGRGVHGASATLAHDACGRTPYPDALVQIAAIAGAPRSGDLILSAAPDWDFRSRFEPSPHRSTHGALLREHMLVPLLMSHAAARTPRRTADVMPSALTAIGCALPAGLDGESFV